LKIIREGNEGGEHRSLEWKSLPSMRVAVMRSAFITAPNPRLIVGFSSAISAH
jgi:hypothetical protein